jgi:hypothetical protein
MIKQTRVTMEKDRHLSQSSITMLVLRELPSDAKGFCMLKRLHGSSVSTAYTATCSPGCVCSATLFPMLLWAFSQSALTVPSVWTCKRGHLATSCRKCQHQAQDGAGHVVHVRVL